MRKEKLSQISSAPNINLNSSNKDFINYNNISIEKNMFPKIVKDNQKLFSSTMNERNSKLMTFLNEAYK